VSTGHHHPTAPAVISAEHQPPTSSFVSRGPGVMQPATSPPRRFSGHRLMKWASGHRALVTCAVVVLAAAIMVAVAGPRLTGAPRAAYAAQSVRYLGVYEPDAPRSYAGIDQFAQAIGKQPNLACYYSSWLEPFQSGFAVSAAERGAVPLVQINPAGVSLTAIASGQYDAYLRDYAAAVRSYRHQVILSFGHEMNGQWYSWGYRHTSPGEFVAAWRHIVTVFRAAGAANVTWLWTINIIDTPGGIPGPAPWWPGSSYVNWIGIDGYYFKSSWMFAPLFGPTIKAVRAFTGDPILIAETGASLAVGQPAKVTNLFAGIRAYGLLGFVWFDATAIQDWRLDSPAAIAAFRRAALAYTGPAP
jgi:mannan endo-1,4-beta-mannosidase